MPSRIPKESGSPTQPCLSCYSLPVLVPIDITTLKVLSTVTVYVAISLLNVIKGMTVILKRLNNLQVSIRTCP